jgi:O-antigen/teichoic acid export membrane protein
MTHEQGETEIVALKTIVKGAGIVFAGMFISKIIAYVYRLFIARYFGPSDYGLFSLGIAVISIFTGLAVLGLPPAVTRYVAHYEAKRDKRRVKGVIMIAMKIVLISSTLLFAGLFVISDFLANAVFHDAALAVVFMVLSLTIPFSSLFAVVHSMFVGFKRIEYRVYTENICQNLSRLAFIIIFGVLGYGVLGLAWAWALAAMLTFMFSLHLFRKAYPYMREKVSAITENRELLSFSLPLIPTMFIGFIALWTDTLMLGYFRTSAEVGIYNAAIPTAQLLFVIPETMLALFLPIMTGLLALKKKTELERVYKTVIRWIFYANLPIFLLMVLFSRQVLNILFGPEYVSGYVALIILSVGIMLHKSLPSRRILQILEETKSLMYVIVIGAALNVALNWMLIPLDADVGIFVVGGVIGAALATMTTYVFYFLVMLWLSYRSTGINPFSRRIVKAVVAGALATGVVFVLARAFFSEFTIFILAGLFVVFVTLYGIALLVLGGVSSNDIEIIKAIEKKTGVRIAFVRNMLKRFVRGKPD